MTKLRTPMLLMGIFLIISACTTPAVPATQTVEDTPTLAPYPNDTPSPPQINAPVVETPSLVSIQFINSLEGWGVTETRIVRTNDSGFTWYNVTPPGITETGYNVDLYAIDPSNAWLQIPDVANYPNAGNLYRTTDGGLTWTSNSVPFSRGHIAFLDANNGWVLADLGVGAGSNAVAVYQTTDGGVNWTQKYINDPNNANAGDSLPLGGLKYGLAPVDMQTAFVYGVVYAPGTIYLFRTDDGGATWAQVAAPLPPNAENAELSVEQLEFVSPGNGFLAVRLTSDTIQLAIYVTNDAGNTWTLTPTLIPDGGSADFLSVNDAVVYNGQQFYVTRDAARTWSIIPPDVQFGETFAVMDFSDLSTGWVLTYDPTSQRSLYRSVDGGTTWFPVVP